MDTIFLAKQFMDCMHIPVSVGTQKDDSYHAKYESAVCINKISVDLREKMLGSPCPKGLPLLLLENDSIALCKIEVKNPDCEIVLIGPVRIGDFSPVAVYDFLNKYKADPSKTIHINSCGMKELTSGIIFLYYTLTQNKLSADELWERNGIDLSELEQTADRNIGKVIFERQEERMAHNPYDEEIREMDSIKNGDLNRLKAAFQESYSGKEGTLSDDPIRQAKNIAIVVITLASRKAIEGGLYPEISFSMVDGYIQQIERMNNPVKIRQFMRDAEMTFTERVAEAKGDQRTIAYNPLIERVKNEIFRQLHGKIDFGKIAHDLNVSQSYLSQLFSATEGMTMQQYVRHQKMKLAENLLRYSAYSVLEIANYLGFCSSSHFISVFTREIGLTPLKYRKRYQKLN